MLRHQLPRLLGFLGRRNTVEVKIENVGNQKEATWEGRVEGMSRNEGGLPFQTRITEDSGQGSTVRLPVFLRLAAVAPA